MTIHFRKINPGPLRKRIEALDRHCMAWAEQITQSQLRLWAHKAHKLTVELIDYTCPDGDDYLRNKQRLIVEDSVRLLGLTYCSRYGATHGKPVE